MSTKDQIKKVLAAIEPLQVALQAADIEWAEVDRLAGVLTARKEEVREAEEWLGRTKIAAQEATIDLDRLRETAVNEEKRIAGRLDPLRAELLALEKEIAQKLSQRDAVLASMAQLQRRLGIA